MRNCLVMGTGRSGTSMLAGVLHKSGWNTGDNYLTARDTNPSGFYEDRTVNRLNDRILQTGDPALWVRSAAWAGVAPVRRGLWFSIPFQIPWLPKRAVSTVRELVTAEPFAYKDPRFCFTYQAWRKHLPADTVRIVMFREPGRTVASLMREKERYGRLDVSEEEAFEVWASAYRHLLFWSGDTAPWLFVHFDWVIDGSAFPILEKALGAPLDRSHVDPTLRTSSAVDTPDFADAVYRRLRAVAA